MPDEQHTLSLFEDDAKEFRLSSVVDELNDRYGNGAVYFAGIQSVLDTAQTKIAFTSIPELGAF
jgi:hypothetical protein